MSGLRRVAVRVPAADVEVAVALLLQRAPQGFEQRDLDGVTELAVFTDDAGEAELRRVFPGASSERVEPGWEDRWREFHRPVRAGGLWIGPPWIDAPPGATVVVDPGRAFGTGAHPTTRACIELLATLERGSLLDAGCGSGIVSVAAARLGFAPVRAVDHDEAAVEIARETARENGVDVDVAHVNVLVGPLPGSDVLVANIELGIVERLLERARAPVAVMSGYLAADAPRAKDWTAVRRLELEGWAADVLVHK